MKSLEDTAEDTAWIYKKIRRRARQIVSRFPPPDFYSDFPDAVRLSRQFFETDPLILRLRSSIETRLDDDFGHGLKHAVKVSLDAGALMAIEGSQAGYSDDYFSRRIRVAQFAGLIHDIRRKEKNHAVIGAACAKKILKIYPLSVDEIEDVCMAIRNHEAFKKTPPIDTPEGRLVSGCLYDADKFRWGPDNFMDTVWDMATFMKIPLWKFIERYPKGLEILKKAGTTFRTSTGKKYGPRFIDLGLAIGNKVYDAIVADFAEYLHENTE